MTLKLRIFHFISFHHRNARAFKKALFRGKCLRYDERSFTTAEPFNNKFNNENCFTYLEKQIH